MPTKYTAEQRIVSFWSRVEKSDGCWMWKNTSGKQYYYGTIQIDNKPVHAHRFSYEMHYGPIPDGMLVCHSCDHPGCVRPDHLFLGTPKDNMHDKLNKGRHVFTTPPRRTGEYHPQAIMTQAQVDEVRARYAQGGITQKALADEFGVQPGVIWSIVHHKTWHGSMKLA